MKINSGIAFLLGISALWAGDCRAGDSLPSQGYAAERYETLWTKSPFAVATPDATDQPSEYSLVGIAKVEGVDYASLVNKQSGDRYFLASGKPQDGLSLVSVQHGEDRSKTVAVIQDHGQNLTLKFADATSATTGAAGPPPQPQPNGLMPGQPMMPPGANPAMSQQTGGAFPSTMAPQFPQGGWNPNRMGQPPMPMVRHPFIRVPAPPPQPQ